ncbi:hypothetical protein [Microtetraspora sp. NBRC 16547]|uniref:hypothetical protein n=1 Tax=Microtetraspora sp. NBRC 16547 TaxID=3030993 RepID=UPI0024A27360|nr:hypothetical protein [Microtetraspora sp. NBRC 16547]GLW96434.1 hypothetical protein Misp02_05210 [Microtetraspora sp. NBRC 16547]
MSETPMEGRRRRHRERTRARDWFSPPPRHQAPQAPQIPIPGRLRRDLTDLRVWPPLSEDEDKDRSTQPFPAVTGTRVPSPAAPAPAPQQAPQQAPPPLPPAQEPSPEPPASGGRAPMPRGKRIALQGTGALLSVVIAVAAPGWFAYGVYEYGRPSDHIQVVQPGQTATWQHVSWRLTVQPIPDPTGKKDTSDRQWMKIIATRTALDGEGAIRHGAPDVEFKDRAGRTWKTELLNDATPPDTEDNKVGTPYRLEFVGVVPPAVADEVMVELRPSISRSVPGQSVEDMMKESVTMTEKRDQVLRFLR